MSYLTECLLLMIAFVLSKAQQCITNCGNWQELSSVTSNSEVTFTVDCNYDQSTAYASWTLSSFDVDYVNVLYSCYNELGEKLNGFPKYISYENTQHDGNNIQSNGTGHYCEYYGCADIFNECKRIERTTCTFGSSTGALSSEVIITNMQPSLTEITYTLSSSFDNYQHGSLIVSSSPEPHINQLQTSTSDAVVNTIATSLLSENVQPTLSNSSQGSLTGDPFISIIIATVMLIALLLVCGVICIVSIPFFLMRRNRKSSDIHIDLFTSYGFFPDFDNISTTGSTVTVIQGLEPISVQYSDNKVHTEDTIKQYMNDDSINYNETSMEKSNITDHTVTEEELSMNSKKMEHSVSNSSDVSQGLVNNQDESLHAISVHVHVYPCNEISDYIMNNQVINYNLKHISNLRNQSTNSYTVSSDGYLY